MPLAAPQGEKQEHHGKSTQWTECSSTCPAKHTWRASTVPTRPLPTTLHASPPPTPHRSPQIISLPWRATMSLSRAHKMAGKRTREEQAVSRGASPDANRWHPIPMSRGCNSPTPPLRDGQDGTFAGVSDAGTARWWQHCCQERTVRTCFARRGRYATRRTTERPQVAPRAPLVQQEHLARMTKRTLRNGAVRKASMSTDDVIDDA